MARIEHPAGVFSGACTRSLAEIAREFTRSRGGGTGEERRKKSRRRRRRKIFPKDVNTNEAKSSPLAGRSEAPHGARWRQWRPYGGRWWRRDATQGRLTRLGSRTDRGGSGAGASGATAAATATGTLRHGVLRVGGAATRRRTLRIVPRGTRARRRGRRRGQSGRFHVTPAATAATAATTATLAFALLLLQPFALTPFRSSVLEPHLKIATGTGLRWIVTFTLAREGETVGSKLQSSRSKFLEKANGRFIGKVAGKGSSTTHCLIRRFLLMHGTYLCSGDTFSHVLASYF